MIGGGGSTANRAAADVIGGCGACAAPGDEGAAEPDDEAGDTAPALDGDAAGAPATCGGRDSTGLLGIAGGIGRGAIGRGTAGVVEAAGTGASPRKSLTRVSTSWLIEMLLVSQNAFSRSYVVRLTLMLRRVCFLAMVDPYATGRVSSR